MKDTYCTTLTCGHCRKFNHSAVTEKCTYQHNKWAVSDTPACAYFHRLLDSRIVELDNGLIMNRRKSDQIQWVG